MTTHTKYSKYALLVSGLFYVLLPHSSHQQYSLDWFLGINLSHSVHVALGVGMLIVAYLLHAGRLKRG